MADDDARGFTGIYDMINMGRRERRCTVLPRYCCLGLLEATARTNNQWYVNSVESTSASQ